MLMVIGMENNKKIDFEFLKLQYQVLSNKQISHNTRVWNIPSMLFIAETLLWGIAVNKEIPSALAFLFSIFSTFVAWSARQQFIRGRIMEIADSEQLFAIEKIIREHQEGEKETPIMTVHHTLDNRTLLTKSGEISLANYLMVHNQLYSNNWIGKCKTFYIWDKVFLSMSVISILLTLYKAYTLVYLFLL